MTLGKSLKMRSLLGGRVYVGLPPGPPLVPPAPRVDSLERWNFIACCWHSTLCLVILLLWGIKNPPFMIEFNKMWAKQTSFPPVFNSTECNGTEYASRGFTEWRACNDIAIKSWQAKNLDVPLFQPVLEKGNEFPVAGLCLIFEFITAGMHGWLWFLDYRYESFYSKRLQQMLQPWRWIEYSITASIMVWCALASSMVQDQFLLLSLFLNSFALNIIGGLCFEVCYWAERKAKEQKREPERVLFRNLKWGCFFTSWIFFLSYTWTSWDALETIVSPFLELPSAVLWEDLFGLVYIINGIITGTFFLFPAIHAYQFVPKRKLSAQKKAYVRGEKLFIIASFVAKTALVFAFTAQAFTRNDS